MQTHCTGCHSTGRTGESPLAIAPPFRTLNTRYLIENLAEALAEEITTGHPTMPGFRLACSARRLRPGTDAFEGCV